MTQGKAYVLLIYSNIYPMSTEFWKSIKHGTMFRGLRLISGTAVRILLVWERAHTSGKGPITTLDFTNINANQPTRIWTYTPFVLGRERERRGLELRLGGDVCFYPALSRVYHRHGQQRVHPHSREICFSVQDHNAKCTFTCKYYAWIV